jgi:DNA-binding transcriptional LysR family regulator
MPSRQVAGELLNRTVDCGVLTFHPSEKGLQTLPLGNDELVMLAHPKHPLAGRRRVSLEEVGRQTVIAHNDPSPARDRVLRVYERRHAPINIQVALPSLDGIKRAVEMGVGVAVLPRRCALTELSRGQLAAVRIPGLSTRRQVRLVFRRGELSHAVEAFLDIVRSPPE